MIALYRSLRCVLLLHALLQFGSIGNAAKPFDGCAADPRTPVNAKRDGQIYRQEIVPAATGDRVVFQVFEPTTLFPGQTYPLVLHGHGYGSRRKTSPDYFIGELRASGYYVISIDQRGFGESSGTARVMSPDFEGQNLIAVLDWAEGLEGLRRREEDNCMMVGSYGGSYGGMFQFLLAGADPKQRLRVLAPDAAPHDLNYALNQNEVIKSGWALVLATAGEASDIERALTGPSAEKIAQLSPPNQDPAVYEILTTGLATNRLTDSGVNFLRYHSASYFCRNEAAGVQQFLFAAPDPLTVSPKPPNRPFAKVDALISQGFRDTLFNFNDAHANYQCLKARGGDVRLLTHQAGHILADEEIRKDLSPGTPLDEAFAPFYRALIRPVLQDAGGSSKCGALRDLDALRLAWFDAKLRGNDEALKQALPSATDICLSLGEGDALQVESVSRGTKSSPVLVETAQFNSALIAAGTALAGGEREALLAVQPLHRVPENSGNQVVAGLPVIKDVAFVPQTNCVLPCDPILLLGIGHRRTGSEPWKLVDDQLTPLRGFGSHNEVALGGIAERLCPGDQLALLVYGFHAQYPVTWSRDVLVPATRLEGSLRLPLLEAGPPPEGHCTR